MKTFVHIGKVKAASTFLQNEVFPRLPNVNFLTPDLNNMDYKNVKPDKLNIISNENLFGTPATKPFKTAQLRIERLRKQLGDVSIILITRQPKPWINSVYNQYIKNGGTYSFKKWFIDIFDLEHINEGDNIEYLKTLFSNILIIPYELLVYDPKFFVEIICKFMGENPPRFKNKIYGKKLNCVIIFILRFTNHFFTASKVYRYFNIKAFARRLRGLE